MIVALLGVAWACGPDFPVLLLEDRAEALLGLPEGSFLREAAHLVPATGRFHDGDQAEAEAAGLTDAQWAQVQRVRLAESDAAAWAAGDGLPADVRLYTVGAADWHHGHGEQACARFDAVLALPEPERALRGVWAAYMAAKCWNPTPDATWERVRATPGADPAGLGLHSLGEQARERLSAEDVAGAVALYAAQAAEGSRSGTASLLFVARWIAADDRRLAPALADPLTRRLMVLYAWTRSMELGTTVGDPVAGATPVTGLGLLSALEGSSAVDGADHLAALAYQAGRYDQAARWAGLSNTPLGAWLRAKLAVRAGDLEGAHAAYAEAAAGFPRDTSGASHPELDIGRCRLQEERGLLSLARADYAEALDALLDSARIAPVEYSNGPGWEDAAYVAERVLTVDELVDFVGRRPPGADPIEADLRALLARRLVRAGRTAEAVAFFDDPQLRADAAAYGDALGRAETGSPVDRARGLLDAAALVRPGLYLAGTEVGPDYVVYEGSYNRRWDGDPAEAPPPPSARFRTEDEARRARESAPDPDLRYHYRYVASRQAERAADLLPPTTQAYVVALCRAAAYIRSVEPDRFRGLWERYVATGPQLTEPMDFGWECPAPNWEGAAAVVRGARLRTAGRVGLALLALALIGAAWLRRRGR